MIGTSASETVTYPFRLPYQKSDGELLFEAGKEIAFLRCENARLDEKIARLEAKIRQLEFDAKGGDRGE